MKSLNIIRKDESDALVPSMLLQNTGSMNTILERLYKTQAINDHAILSNFFKRINIACCSVCSSSTGRRVEYKKQKTIAKITTRASVMWQNSSVCCSLGDLGGYMAIKSSSTIPTGDSNQFQMSVDTDWKVMVWERPSVRQSLLNTRSKTINMRLHLIMSYRGWALQRNGCTVDKKKEC